MKINSIKFIVLLFLALLSLQSYAANITVLKTKSINVIGSGLGGPAVTNGVDEQFSVVVTTLTQSNDPNSCVNARTVHFLEPSQTYFDELYSLLLTAHMSKSRLIMDVTNYAPFKCKINGVKIE